MTRTMKIKHLMKAVLIFTLLLAADRELARLCTPRPPPFVLYFCLCRLRHRPHADRPRPGPRPRPRTMTIRGLMLLVFWVALFFAVNAWMARPRPISPSPPPAPVRRYPPPEFHPPVRRLRS